MADYVDNKELREKITTYNNINIFDDGAWCPSYLQRLQNKLEAGKIDQEKFNLGKEFIIKKVASIEDLQARYAMMDPEEKRKFDYKLNQLKNDMCKDFLLIINGRVNSFKLRSQYPDEIDDIVQDALICVLNYINRYDESRGTSAFAYITQLATNSIVLSINQIRERTNRMVTGLDYFDNINTIDSPTDGLSGLSKFIE